jgi:hypothetical protein
MDWMKSDAIFLILPSERYTNPGKQVLMGGDA